MLVLGVALVVLVPGAPATGTPSPGAGASTTTRKPAAGASLPRNPHEALQAARFASSSFRASRARLAELDRLRQTAAVVTEQAQAKTVEVQTTHEQLTTDRKKLEKLRGQVAATRTKAKVEQTK